jgi:hypothetical protein
VSATRTPTPGNPIPTATPAAGSCSSPIVLPASGGTFSGTTSGGSALAGSCATTGNSPETVFQWTPSRSGPAFIRTCGTGTAFDTVAYVRSGSCSGAEIACNDDTTNCQTGEPSPHHGSSIELTVVAGQTHVVVVDGYNGAAGNFTLTVVPPP